MAYQPSAKLLGLNLTQVIIADPESVQGVVNLRKIFTLTKTSLFKTNMIEFWRDEEVTNLISVIFFICMSVIIKYTSYKPQKK